MHIEKNLKFVELQNCICWKVTIDDWFKRQVIDVKTIKNHKIGNSAILNFFENEVFPLILTLGCLKIKQLFLETNIGPNILESVFLTLLCLGIG